ncbi:hypothetical protein [Oceanobacillus kimchii]|uniref:Uncharacterized protein n=1 Tax=Oceanobacillus kimchii TaxID=746691 RepID=A0ABQ5TKW4_9BACI|nr:hypothetical protein [Oceanobacillus kimchii]GLO66229.1 hypothetical protein MACH08_20130 [Oceanobacillus kimchii]
MEVVINSCFGGFALSRKAIEEYSKLKGVPEIYHYMNDYEENVIKKVSSTEADITSSLFVYTFTKDFGDTIIEEDLFSLTDGYIYSPEIKRNDPDLVRVVKQLKDKANVQYSDLKIIEIPDDVNFVIQEYDGNEWIAEEHRTWS